MQFGKSLLGAIIGGVLGIALIIAIHLLTQADKYWLAIPVAIITGLGVRWVVSTHGHPSYARGALTAIVALLAFFAFYPIMAQLRTRQSTAQPVVLDRQDEGNEAAADDEPAEEAPVQPVRMEERAPLGDATVRNARPQDTPVWDIISLCLAAFIAYELGRGSGAGRPAIEEAPADAEMPPQVAGQTSAPPE